MQRVPQRALAGKARKTHRTSRVARLLAQREIEDFLAAEDAVDGPALRPITIRRRNGTITPNVGTIDATGLPPEIQLELPLGSPEVERELPQRQPRARRPNGRSESVPERPLRFEPRDTPAMPPVRVPEAFSMRRYLFGCLLGSAAAAIVLVAALAVLGG